MNSITYSMAVLGLIFLLSIMQEASALKCYTCNSGERYEGEKCEDKHLSEDFLTDCDELSKTTKMNYTMCRKQHQDIEGMTRIFRDCAVTGAEGCARRTGTREITLKYCDCFGDRCNSATGLVNSITVTFGMFFSAIVARQFL